MNFETILFAAAFLLLAVISLARNETPPAEPTESGENSETLAIADTAPGDDVLLSTEPDTDTEIAKDERTETQVD